MVLYRAVRKCFHAGRLLQEGEEFDLPPNCPPNANVEPVEGKPWITKVAPEPHRTEVKDVGPTGQREVQGGMAAGLKKVKLPRILTTDKVPNNVPPPKPKKKRARRKKGVGSAKKSD